MTTLAAVLCVIVGGAGLAFTLFAVYLLYRYESFDVVVSQDDIDVAGFLPDARRQTVRGLGLTIWEGVIRRRTR